MPNVTSGDEFAQALNEFDVRVFPPKTQITPADIMPALNGVIQGDGYQQYAVAAALAEPINQLLKKSSRRGVGFMFRDPDSKKLHFLNQKPTDAVNPQTGKTIWTWIKGREVLNQN